MPTIVLLIWAAILTGFAVDMIRKASANQLHYPWLIHAHAVLYVGWLIVLATQVGLVRSGRLDWHRSLGRVAVVMIPLTALFGLGAMISRKLAPIVVSDSDLAFMGVQISNVIGMTALLTAGFLLRGDSSAHRRLMVMGTIMVTETGFNRIFHAPARSLLGDGVGPFLIETYAGTLLLMLSVGAYDLVTRRRLHPAYVAAFSFMLSLQVLSSWLNQEPFWLAWMKGLTGHEV
jgi:hypothetical protein